MAIDLERTLTQAGSGVIGKGSRAEIEQHGIDRIPDTERRGTPRQVGLMWSGVVLNVQGVLPIIGHAAITRVLRMLIIPFGALFLTLAWLTAGRLHLEVTPPADWAVFLGGIALAASGSGLGWAPNAADYSRYLPSGVSK